MSDLHTAARKIASGLVALTAEHGTPNSFRAGEVADECGLTAMEVGCLMSFGNNLVAEELEKRGLRYTGYSRRFGRWWIDIEDHPGGVLCPCSGETKGITL